MVCVGILVGLAVAVWLVRQPPPAVATLTPTIPSDDAVRASGEVSVTLPDSLFRAPATQPTGARPVAVKVETSWRLLGVELGPPPAALLREGQSKETLWVHEGDAVGDFVVKRIQSGRIVVEGAEGERELRL